MNIGRPVVYLGYFEYHNSLADNELQYEQKCVLLDLEKKVREKWT
jgi:hypothetical protein